MNPLIILVEDEDGGYIKAQLQGVGETEDDREILVYKKVEYYHSLDDALDEC